MSSNFLDPKFIYPVNQGGIFYQPTSARYIMSENPIKRGTIIKMGDLEREIKYSEELTLIVFPQAGRLRVSKGFMTISSEDGLRQFLQLLGFGDRRSFLLATFDKFDTDGNSAKRKLILHHLFDETILPPL
jgi:hypothetical protein